MKSSAIITAAALSLAACANPGSVAVAIYGEEFIERKIPADDLEDGWEIAFSKVLVVVGELRVASSGGEARVQATIHADHLFYDDLQNPAARMRFDAMAAADANDDGEVTLGELAAVPLSSLPLGTYGTGSVANVDDLRSFLTTLLRALGHFQGEGECTPRAR